MSNHKVDTSKQRFLDMIDGMFGDQTLDEGLQDLVAFNSLHENEHTGTIEAIDAAIAAAESDDDTVISCIRDRFLRLNPSANEAVAFLHRFRAEYIRLYSAARSGQSREG